MWTQTPGKIYIVLEYCEGGDLSVYIKRHGPVAQPTAKFFMRQLGNFIDLVVCVSHIFPWDYSYWFSLLVTVSNFLIASL